MRNRRQVRMGFASNLKRLVDVDLKKDNDALKRLLRTERERVGFLLNTYAWHLEDCPWRSVEPTIERCTCGLHEVIAEFLPGQIRCQQCSHTANYHIRTRAHTTHCVHRADGRQCECAQDADPQIAILDAILDRRTRSRG